MKKVEAATIFSVLLWLTISSATPAEGGPISWYEYRVSCQEWVSASYNIKLYGCDNKCFEGHECTNCSGWEVRRGWTFSQLMQSGTEDKTSCCQHTFNCGSDPKYSLCGIANCPANDCPGTTFWKSLYVADNRFHQCAPGQTSVSILPQRLAVGTRENNAWSCGSSCNDGDPFSAYGHSPVVFGYSLSWSCDGLDHADRDCTITLNSACGNGVCELIGNEHQYNCPEDCEGCDPETNPECEE